MNLLLWVSCSTLNPKGIFEKRKNKNDKILKLHQNFDIFQCNCMNFNFSFFFLSKFPFHSTDTLEIV